MAGAMELEPTAWHTASPRQPPPCVGPTTDLISDYCALWTCSEVSLGHCVGPCTLRVIYRGQSHRRSHHRTSRATSGAGPAVTDAPRAATRLVCPLCGRGGIVVVSPRRRRGDKNKMLQMRCNSLLRRRAPQHGDTKRAPPAVAVSMAHLGRRRRSAAGGGGGGGGPVKKRGSADGTVGHETRQLVWACHNGHARRVSDLLRSQDVDIDFRGEHGWTPMLHACHHGCVEIVSALADAGCDMFAASNNGITAAHLAAQGGNEELFAVLHAHGVVPALVNARMDNGWSPIFFACQNGHASLAKLLLSCDGINVDLVDNDGKTPLYFAAQEGHGDVADALLQYGASPDGATNSPKKGSAFPMFIAAQQGHLNVVERLISAGAEPNLQKRDSGASALHIAAWDGHEHIVRTLVAAGASTDLTTRGGWTCMHTAARGGHLNIVRFLCTHPKPVAKRVLANGSLGKRGSLARALRGIASPATAVSGGVGGGGGGGERSRFGSALRCLPRMHKRSSGPPAVRAATPLHIAAGSGHADVVDFLLSCKMYAPDARMTGDATALHIAAQEGHLRTVQVLTVYGAARHPTTDQGVTPLAIAEHRGHDTIVGWLRETEGWGRLRLAMHIGPCAVRRLLTNDEVTSMEITESLSPSGADRASTGLVPRLLAPDVDHAAAVALCRTASLPWRPARHMLFSPAFRSRVTTLLQVAARLSTTSSVLHLPDELWWAILSQTCRS